MSTTGKTFESLRETLQQTLEEKRRIEQKYLEDGKRLEQKHSEDCQRIEQNLAELKNMISTYTAELQTLAAMALKVQSNAPSESLKQSQEGITKPNDSFSFKLGGNWKIVWYLIGTILMFIVLFFLASLFEKPKEKAQVSPVSRSIAIQFPSLLNSAEACVLTDRIRERVQERRGTVDSLPDVTEESSVCDEVEELIEVVESPKQREPRRPVRTLLRSIFRR